MAELKSELKAEMKALSPMSSLIQSSKRLCSELVQVINQNTEELREDLNDAGIKIRTKVRAAAVYSAE